MFFLAPEGWSCPTCKNSELGVDIRGVGGFAMLPPSQHESGKSYGWVEDKEPWTIEIEEMPKWMCNEIDLKPLSALFCGLNACSCHESCVSLIVQMLSY